MSRASEFWKNASEERKELVKTFERNIERHGARGFYECDLKGFKGHCPYCATNVTYYSYEGPAI